MFTLTYYYDKLTFAYADDAAVPDRASASYRLVRHGSFLHFRDIDVSDARRWTVSNPRPAL
jgi:hypothetical protein